MGQKVNPIGLRLGVNRTWDSRWYANTKDYARLLHEDIKIRAFLREKLAAAGISTPFVVLCPFASGAIDGQDKRWPAFPELAQVLARRGMQAVACPGPGEELALEAGFPTVVALPGLSVAAYAAVISQAAAVVANDTGPGHLAAALLVPLISVLGPTDPARWGARGRSVRILRRWPEWPGVEEVVQALPSAHPGKPQAFIRT